MGDIFKERQQRCWWGDGVCACRKDRKSKDIGAVGLQGGQVCLKKSLLLPKRQDSDKLSCLCRQPPCHTHTHTKTSTHRVTTHQWNEWTASVWHISVAGGGERRWLLFPNKETLVWWRSSWQNAKLFRGQQLIVCAWVMISISLRRPQHSCTIFSFLSANYHLYHSFILF